MLLNTEENMGYAGFAEKGQSQESNIVKGIMKKCAHSFRRCVRKGISIGRSRIILYLEKRLEHE